MQQGHSVTSQSLGACKAPLASAFVITHSLSLALLDERDTPMPKHRVLTEFGMGTSLRRQDYTQAARRAVQDALWHNSINMAELFGFPKEAMIIDVEIACQQPDAVDTAALLDIFPYGQPRVTVHHGGLDIPRPDGNPTVIVNAAINVSFNMERI